MASSCGAVGRGRHASVSIGREPRRRGVTGRTLQSSHNVVGLGRGESIAGVGVASCTVGHASVVHLGAGAPAGADRMT